MRRMTEADCDAECSLGNPAPRGVASIWHYDLGKIPGGQKCLECGALFLTKSAKKTVRALVSEFKANLAELGIDAPAVLAALSDKGDAS